MAVDLEESGDSQSHSENSPPAQLSFAAVVGGGGPRLPQSSVGGGIQAAGAFDPFLSLRASSSPCSGLSQEEVKFRAEGAVFSQEQQTLVDSYVGKPYSKWPFEALQLLTKQQFRQLVLDQIVEG